MLSTRAEAAVQTPKRPPRPAAAPQPRGAGTVASCRRRRSCRTIIDRSVRARARSALPFAGPASSHLAGLPGPAGRLRPGLHPHPPRARGTAGAPAAAAAARASTNRPPTIIALSLRRPPAHALNVLNALHRSGMQAHMPHSRASCWLLGMGTTFAKATFVPRHAMQPHRLPTGTRLMRRGAAPSHLAEPRLLVRQQHVPRRAPLLRLLRGGGSAAGSSGGRGALGRGPAAGTALAVGARRV